MKKLIFLLAFFSLSYASNISLEKVFSKEQQTFFLNSLSSKQSKIYDKDFYNLHRGWNQLFSPQDGINIEKTFNDDSVLYVVIFDKISKRWALYSSQENENKDYLKLLYIEPYNTFFVYMKNAKSLKIKSNYINQACQRELKKK